MPSLTSSIDVLKGALGKAEKTMFETVPAASRSLFQIGIPKSIKIAGTGAAALAIGSLGIGFAATKVNGALKDLGIKSPTPADNLNAYTDAMKNRENLMKSMFDEAMQENKAIKADPTIYGGLGNYGTPDLLSRDALLKGLGPGFSSTPAQNTTPTGSGFNWGVILLVGLALVGGFLAFKKISK